MYCLNPTCPKPQNADTDSLCRTCGFGLRLHNSYSAYSAIRLLGQGGHSRTWFGRHQSSISTDVERSTPCVIKQLLKIPTFAEAEAELLKRLSETGQTPRLIDAFADRGCWYLVQEWIAGDNLAIELKQGEFSEAKIWQILHQVLPVLQAVHQHRLIHQDIKPENLIRRSDDRLMLVGFGTGKLADESLEGDSEAASTAINCGSPEYSAPEQTQGEASYTSDLYSLGVTCIHLLTDISPFDLYDSFNHRWMWRDYLEQKISDRLARILDQLIHPEKNQRFQSAEAVLQLLPAAPIPRPAPPQFLQAQGSISTPSPIHTIALHPNQPILASGGDDRIIYLWNWQTQERLNAFKGHTGPIRTIAFSPDGTLASGSDDKTIRFWNCQTSESMIFGSPDQAHTGSVRSLQFSADGKTLISGSWDKTVKLWSVATGKVIHSFPHKLQVTAVGLSPNHQWFASGSCDRTAKLWPLQSGDQDALVPPDALPDSLSVSQPVSQPAWSGSDHLQSVISLAFSPDSQTIATGSDDNTIKLWHVPTGQLKQTLTRHSWSVAALAFSADGHLLVSGSWDQTVQLWRARTATTLIGHSDAVTTVAITADTNGYWVLSGGRDRQIKCWSIPLGCMP